MNRIAHSLMIIVGIAAAVGAGFYWGNNFQKNADHAAGEVRKLMFLEKLQQDIDEAIVELEDAL